MTEEQKNRKGNVTNIDLCTYVLLSKTQVETEALYLWTEEQSFLTEEQKNRKGNKTNIDLCTYVLLSKTQVEAEALCLWTEEQKNRREHVTNIDLGDNI